MAWRLGAIALAASLVLLLAAGARASALTAAQLHALAGRAAAGDARALAELRGVSTVDGQPVQIAQALNARTARQLSSRLVALADAGAGATQSPETAQRAAAAILASRRYRTAPVPDPVGTLLDKLARALSRLASGAPGGPVAFWGVVAIVVLALTALGVRRTMRRLDPPARARAASAEPAREDPASLEREALQAEARGAFSDAVRLRFRAGLLGLSAQQTIEYRPSLLTTDVARRLRSPQFDALAATFERVAYGGAAAAQEDATAAREDWKLLLKREVGR
jgi:hypothetical protein